MGYRSDVCLCLKKSILHEFDVRLVQSEPDKSETVSAFMKTAESITNNASGDRLWFWRDVKWDLDFAEVAFIEAFMDEVPQTDYLFIRVGDYIEDNEIRGWYYQNNFDLRLKRTIEFEKQI